MRWFRFYSEALDDNKVQALPPPLFKHWVNLLCVASYHEGEIANLQQAAFRLRLPPRRAQAIIDQLVGRGLLEPGGEGWAPHNWAGRQFSGDSSTARVDRYRGRVRSMGQQVGGYLKDRGNILHRDGYRCVYCGSGEKLCVDHAMPVQLGGGDDPDNLVTACKQCNSGKAGRTPEQAGYKFQNKETETVYRGYLSRLQKEGATVTATSPEAETEQNRTDPETDSEAEETPNIFRLYEQTIGPFDPHMATKLEEAEKEYSWECIRHSFEEASELNKRSWRYVEAILRAHKANGCYAGKRGSSQSDDRDHDEIHRRHELADKRCPICYVPEDDPEVPAEVQP